MNLSSPGIKLRHPVSTSEQHAGSGRNDRVTLSYRSYISITASWARTVGKFPSSLDGLFHGKPMNMDDLGVSDLGNL